MIVFDIDINDDVLQYSYNNNVLVFHSNLVLVPTMATITFFDETITLYPHPNGSFWVNLKEWLKILSGRNKFIDTLDANLDSSDTFNYDWTTKGIVSDVMEFKILFSGTPTTDTATKDFVFINGLVQIEDFRRRFPLALPKIGCLALHPFERGTNYSSFVRYWNGYPLDITVYSGENTSYQIYNNATSQNVDFDVFYTVNRTFFSDGRTDIGIAELLMLTEGMNRLTINTGASSFEIKLDKVQGCEKNTGHYIKWINSLGGYSYWLFHKGNRNRPITDLGDIGNDFNNIQDTVSPTINIGKQTNDTLTVGAYNLTPQEQTLLVDLYDSPAVFLFTGVPFDRNNFNDWLQVKTKNSSPRIDNSKSKNANFEFTFELTERFNRTL